MTKTTPSHYTITRNKDSKPASAMRVIMSAPEPEGTDAGLAEGGTFVFEPGESQAMPAALAAAFMADAGHQEHFTIDPPLPKKVLADAIKADEARTADQLTEPSADDTGGAKKPTTRK